MKREGAQRIVLDRLHLEGVQIERSGAYGAAGGVLPDPIFRVDPLDDARDAEHYSLVTFKRQGLARDTRHLRDSLTRCTGLLATVENYRLSIFTALSSL